jgi:ABC-type sugar transport system permease subunit
MGEAWRHDRNLGEFWNRVMSLPFYRALAFTLTYTFVVTPFVLVLGLAIARGRQQPAQDVQGPTIFVSLLPMIVTPLVGSLILFWMVDADGIIGATLQNIFNDPRRSAEGLGPLTWIMLIVYGIWSSIPFSFIVFYAGLQTVPEDTMEAAMIDGASKWQRMRHVVVPHLMPLVVFITLIQLMDNFRVFEPIVSFQARLCAVAEYDHLQRPARREPALRLGGRDLDADDPRRGHPAHAGADPHLARLQPQIDV